MLDRGVGSILDEARHAIEARLVERLQNAEGREEKCAGAAGGVEDGDAALNFHRGVLSGRRQWLCQMARSSSGPSQFSMTSCMNCAESRLRCEEVVIDVHLSAAPAVCASVRAALLPRDVFAPRLGGKRASSRWLVHELGLAQVVATLQHALLRIAMPACTFGQRDSGRPPVVVDHAAHGRVDVAVRVLRKSRQTCVAREGNLAHLLGSVEAGTG